MPAPNLTLYEEQLRRENDSLRAQLRKHAEAFGETPWGMMPVSPESMARLTDAIKGLQEAQIRDASEALAERNRLLSTIESLEAKNRLLEGRVTDLEGQGVAGIEQLRTLLREEAERLAPRVPMPRHKINELVAGVVSDEMMPTIIAVVRGTEAYHKLGD